MPPHKGFLTLYKMLRNDLRSVSSRIKRSESTFTTSTKVSPDSVKTNSSTPIKRSDSNLTSHDNVTPKCTYKHLEFCHPYIRNVFIMYTGSGGWLLLCIVLVGTSLQIFTMLHHKLCARNRNLYGPVRKKELALTRNKWI